MEPSQSKKFFFRGEAVMFGGHLEMDCPMISLRGEPSVEKEPHFSNVFEADIVKKDGMIGTYVELIRLGTIANHGQHLFETKKSLNDG